MLRLGNANAIVIQGLIAQRGLDCLKALISWKFENKPDGEGGGKTLVLRAPLVAISAQKGEGPSQFVEQLLYLIVTFLARLLFKRP